VASRCRQFLINFHLGDAGDKINFNLRGQHSSLFTIDQRGVIWLREPLGNFKKSEISLIASATDSGQRTSTVPVTLVMDPEASVAKFPSLLGVMAGIFVIFVLIVILISIFVYKRLASRFDSNGDCLTFLSFNRKSNQVHSNLPSMQSSAGLVSQEKRLMTAHMCDPTQDQMNFCTSSSSLSPGASTIIAASLAGDPNDHNKPTIGALARSGYRGRFYQHNNNEDIEKDSITNSDTTRDLNIMNRADQRNKKLSWQHDDFQQVKKLIVSYFIMIFIRRKTMSVDLSTSMDRRRTIS